MSNREKSCGTPFKTMIGGQALIEGIMMMGPEKKAIVVRKPDGGLEEKADDRVLIKDKYPVLGLPFIRGIFSFGSSMANGVKALMYSASFFPEDEEEPEEPSRFELWLEERLGSEKAAGFFVTLAVILASPSPWASSSCCPPPWWAPAGPWPAACPCGCATCWRAWSGWSSLWATSFSAPA